jgi:hypothetical protein
MRRGERQQRTVRLNINNAEVPAGFWRKLGDDAGLEQHDENAVTPARNIVVAALRYFPNTKQTKKANKKEET